MRRSAYRAMEEAPEVMIDFATLTGAHRVALGADLPGVFTDCDALAADIAAASAAEADPTWRLPLWKPYAKMVGLPGGAGPQRCPS